MIKVKIYNDWVTGIEPINYKEYISDIDYKIWDNIVICEKTKSICKYQDSAQGLDRLKQLKKIKEPTEFEAQELKFLEWDKKHNKWSKLAETDL